MSDEQQTNEEILRTRIPLEGEIFAIVTEMLGANKMRVECDDGNIRIGRIPGKLRKRVWIRVGDLVLVQPWKVQSNERCDIIWRYTSTQANWLKKKGYIKNLNI
ncbi:MAG: translation initiation factor eIF-1A [Candidatus Aenigmatarchaeota archaeon]|nr:translation initiation factor eIF-1A [Candidatus Aenigmarchaeota archaeon]